MPVATRDEWQPATMDQARLMALIKGLGIIPAEYTMLQSPTALYQIGRIYYNELRAADKVLAREQQE
jgi:hypothetical protein